MAKRKRVKRRMRPGCLVSLVSFVLVVLGGVILFMTPLFNVDKITVKGNDTIAKSVILRLSGLETGENIFAMSTRRAEKKISGLQYVENVRVKRKLPDKIEIEITEGEADFYIKDGEKLVGINKDCRVLCCIDLSAAKAGTPVVNGFTVEKRTMGETLLVEEKDRFDLFLRFVKMMEKTNLSEGLSQFDLSDEDDISFMYMDKLLVEFGDVSHYENKFNNLVSIIATLTESSGGEVPTGIVNMTSDNYTFRSVVPKKSE